MITITANKAAVTTPSFARASETHGTLGLRLLIALVVGSNISSDIFALPQNMAAGTGAGAIAIGWVVTGIGLLMLALAYQILAL